MKRSGVRIGSEYMIADGAALVRVRIKEARTFSAGTRRTLRYIVQRIDTEQILPDAKTSLALKPLRARFRNKRKQ
jgi:hypothetical protein